MTAVILRAVCSWCTRVLVEGTPGASTTHVCCATCIRKLLQDVA